MRTDKLAMGLVLGAGAGLLVASRMSAWDGSPGWARGVAVAAAALYGYVFTLLGETFIEDMIKLAITVVLAWMLWRANAIAGLIGTGVAAGAAAGSLSNLLLPSRPRASESAPTAAPSDNKTAGARLIREAKPCGLCGREAWPVDELTVYPIYTCGCGAQCAAAFAPDLDEAAELLLERLGIAGQVQMEARPVGDSGLVSAQPYNVGRAKRVARELLDEAGYDTALGEMTEHYDTAQGRRPGVPMVALWARKRESTGGDLAH